MSFVFLLLGLIAAYLATAAATNRALWVPAMVGAELASWFSAASLLLVVVASVLGLVQGLMGVSATILLVGSMIGFGVAAGRGLGAAAASASALGEFIGRHVPPWRLAWVGLLVPIALRPRRMVSEEGLRYGPHARHIVDHLRIPSSVPRPALVFVHGGGFWRGRRDTQARPVLHRAVLAGWSVFTPSYRLSPEATFPEHLVDVKRVIAWVRANAEQLGVDPGFIVVAGASSGGNLAALAALTPGRADLQPGFENADASVQACVPFYGVHDLLRPSGAPLWPYLEASVMKVSPQVDPDPWIQASPVRVATEERPPFFVVHGAADTLVGVGHSRRLVEALDQVGGPRVGYFEVPHANHGFDFFASPRGRVAAATVLDALQHLRDREPSR